MTDDAEVLNRPGHAALETTRTQAEHGEVLIRWVIPRVYYTPPWYILFSVKYAGDKDKLTARLSRVEGQVRGISRMVSEDKYCIDILTQVNAAKAALDKVSLLLIEAHVKGCVVASVREGDMHKLDELVGAVARFARA